MWHICALLRSNQARERDRGLSWAPPLLLVPVTYFPVAPLDRDNKLWGSLASALSVVRGSGRLPFPKYNLISDVYNPGLIPQLLLSMYTAATNASNKV